MFIYTLPQPVVNKLLIMGIVIPISSSNLDIKLEFPANTNLPFKHKCARMCARMCVR